MPEDPSKELITNALKALDSLHDHGVLHGDVALRNFVCKDDETVFIIDFGFSRLQEDLDESEWMERTMKEKRLLRKELGVDE